MRPPRAGSALAQSCALLAEPWSTSACWSPMPAPPGSPPSRSPATDLTLPAGPPRLRRRSDARNALSLNRFAIPAPPIGQRGASQFNQNKEDKMICQTPNDDPCSRVTSPAEAVEYAEALLARRRRRVWEFWAAAAVGPLAGMLYAASPSGNNEGIGWLIRATAAIPDHASATARRCARLGAGVPVGTAPSPCLADQPRLSNELQRALKLHPRQRDSLVMMIRDALSSWKQAESCDEHE